MAHASRWIITADTRRATLFACEPVPGGGTRLERLTSIVNAHEGEHERHRPSLLGGAERRGAASRSSAHAAPHAAAERRTEEEERRRFARDLSSWLAEVRRQFGVTAVTLFAPPRLLGVLREHVNAGETELREADLAHLRPQKLSVHPAVRDAVGV
jgi:hypothetical protein